MAASMFPANRFRFYSLVNVGDIGRFSMTKCCNKNNDFTI